MDDQNNDDSIARSNDQQITETSASAAAPALAAAVAPSQPIPQPQPVQPPQIEPRDPYRQAIEEYKNPLDPANNNTKVPDAVRWILSLGSAIGAFIGTYFGFMAHDGDWGTINPITGKPFTSVEERLELTRLIPDLDPRAVQRLRELYQKRKAELENAEQQAQKFSDHKDPNACTEPCPPQVAAPSSITPVQQPAPGASPTKAPVPGPKETIQLKCKEGWSDCQKHQAQAKVEKLNQLAQQQNGLIRRTFASTADKVKFERLKQSWIDKFNTDFWRALKDQPPIQRNPQTGATGTANDFTDPCLYQQFKDQGLAGMAVDHIHDTGWSGAAEGPFKYLDGDVNSYLGSQMVNKDNKDVKTAKKFKLDCGKFSV